jgi:hypothetical protein
MIMGQYKLIVDTDASDKARVENWINSFTNRIGGNQFLNIPRLPGGTIIVTDNPTSKNLSEGNKNILRVNGRRQRGLSQDVGRLMIYVNPTPLDGKPALNILVHEIGHKKWSGLGMNENHDPCFYRLLNDALRELGLEVDDVRDLNGVDISNVPSPEGTSALTVT